MFTDQHAFPFEEMMRAVKRELLLQTLDDSARPFDAQARETIDAIAAMVLRAQAGLQWLRIQPPNLEEVRQSFSSIATDGKRACELVVRLRSMVKPDS